MPYNFLIQLAIAVIFFVIGELLRPKPDFEDAEALPFSEARIPQVNPERKQAVIWGRIDLTSAHVMDVAEYNTIAVKKKVKTGLFSSKKVVIAHRYFFGVQLGLCKGPGVVIRKIFYDDKELWSGVSDGTADTTGYIIDIDLPQFLGGREEGGGIKGRFRFFSGDPNQSVSAYLATFQDPTPAYRWTSYVEMENVEVGETPNIEAFHFQIERYPDPLSLGGDNIIGAELNPMSLVAECFTDDDWGFNRPTEIDIANMAASGSTLKTEGNGMSLKWTQNNTIDRIIDQINKQVDGILRFNPKVGLWEYKLLRDDYVFANLPIFNETNIKELVNFSRANWSETINQIEITYTARGQPEKPAPAIMQDQANFKRQGRHKVLRLSFPAVYTDQLATDIAARELRIGAFPVSSGELTIDRSAWDMLPGDAFRLQWLPLGITDIVMRAGSVGFGDLEQTEVSVGAIEDIFGLATNVFALPPPSFFTSVNPAPVAISTRLAVDQDFFFALRDPLRVINPPTAEKPFLAAAQPQGNSLEWALETRQGTDPFVREGVQAFNPTGTLQSAILPNAGDGVEITTLIIENMVNAGILTDKSGGDDTIVIDGENLMLVVSTETDPFTAATYEPELMAFDTVAIAGNVVTLTGVHRALSDTISAGFAIGDRVWFLTGTEIDGPTTTDLTYGDADSIDIRYINIATTGEGSAAAATATMRDRVSLPWLPRNYRIEGQRYPASTFPLNQAFTLEWYHGNRVFAGTTAGRLWFQDDASGPSSIETDFEYLLVIYDDITNTLLRRIRPSGSGNTPAGDDTFTTAISYEYTLAKQQADGGPFARYRSELFVEETLTGAAVIISLLTVYRTWTVVVPVSLTQRGPVFNELKAHTAHRHYGFNQAGATPYIDETGAGSDGSSLGTVGIGGPGVDPLTFGVATTGVDTTGLSIPDADATFESGTNFDFAIIFHCRVVADAQTDDRILIAKRNSASTAEYYILIDEFGKWTTQLFYGSVYTVSQGLSLLAQLEDGLWHQIIWSKSNGASALFIDGGIQDVDAVGTSSMSPLNSDPLSIGGYSGAGSQSLGWAKAHFAQWYLDNVGFGYNDVAVATREFWRRTPWASATMSLMTEADVLMNYGKTINNASFTDRSGRRAYNVPSAWIPTTDSSLDNGNDIVKFIQSNGGVGNINITSPKPINDGYLNYGHGTKNGSSSHGISLKADLWNGYLLQGPQEFSAWAIVSTDLVAEVYLFAAVDVRFEVSETEQGEEYWIRVTTGGEVEIKIEVDTGDRRTHVTTSTPITADVVAEIFVTNEITTGWRCWVDGLEHALSESTAGAFPPTDAFLNDRLGGITPTSTLYMRALLGYNQTSDPDAIWWSLGYRLSPTDPDDIVLLYASRHRPAPTMLDVLLDDNPEHVFQVLDNTAQDLRDNITGAPTATGTFTTDEEVPIPQDDETKPQRFDGTNDLAYGAQALVDGILQDFSIVVIAQIYDVSADQVLFANYNNVDAVTDSNLRIIYDNGNGDIRFESLNGGVSIAGIAKTAADPFCIGLIESDLGTDEWDWYENAGFDSQVTTNNAYGGAAMDRFRIGAEGTQTLPLDGNTHYAVFYDRSIDPSTMRRIQAKFRGLTGQQLELQGWIDAGANLDGAIFPLDDKDPTAIIENSIINDTALQNMNINGSGFTVVEGLLGVNVFRYIQLASGTYFKTISPIGSFAYPFTVGGYVRVDSGTESFISLSNAAFTQQFAAVGISGGRAAVRTADNDTPHLEMGTTVISTTGQFAHVAVTYYSDVDRKLYLNGELEASFTDSININAQTPSEFSVNRITGPNDDYAGSYQMAWCQEGQAFTEAEHMRIFAGGVLPAWQFVTAKDVPIAQWLLDESRDGVTGTTAVFRDQYNADYAAVASSTGVTVAQIGLVPNRKSLCVDLDGANGGIDTNFLAYPTTTAARAFECWIEGGFVGTIVSMGANVDAEALVISVDGSGDLSIHIRGSGNERIWTTAIDVGTEHHLVVQLATSGDSLHDFEVWLNGVEETTIGTAGTDTTLATTATLDLFIGEDVTDLATADGTGKIQGVTVYDSNAAPLAAKDIEIRYAAGIAIRSLMQ